jgi:uncharacterized protein YidB (DUF937 family)
MGLFDEITAALTNKISGEETQSPLLETVVNVINNPDTGGLAGLVQTFKDKGLADAVSSWVSTGQNVPVSGEQIQSVLGSEQIQQVAEKMGISNEAASGSLASLLPEIIDKLTPNGSLPEGGLLEQGLALFKKQLSGA